MWTGSCYLTMHPCARDFTGNLSITSCYVCNAVAVYFSFCCGIARGWFISFIFACILLLSFWEIIQYPSGVCVCVCITKWFDCHQMWHHYDIFPLILFQCPSDVLLCNYLSDVSILYAIILPVSAPSMQLSFRCPSCITYVRVHAYAHVWATVYKAHVN